MQLGVRAARDLNFATAPTCQPCLPLPQAEPHQMARFSAYTSDTSEDEDDNQSSSSSLEEVNPRHASRLPEVDEDEDEEEEESEEESESGSSDMHEDELSPLARKKPTRNALVEDEDGDIYYAHEVGQRSVSLSKSPPPRAHGDPTIIPWAQQIGVDAQKMHVMQTSLFRMPEEAAAMKAIDSSVRPQFLLPLNLSRKHSRDSDGDLRIDAHEVCCRGHGTNTLLKLHLST